MQKSFMILAASVLSFLISSCNLNQTVPGPEIGNEQGIVFSRTNSYGPTLNDETRNKIINSKIISHTFSNGKTKFFFNENGDTRTTTGLHGGIAVSRVVELPDLIIEFEKEIEKLHTQGVGINPDFTPLFGGRPWQGGIPYIIDISITGSNLSALQQAIADWNSSSFSAIKFRPRVSSLEPWVNFVLSGTDCWSYVGNVNGINNFGVFTGQNVNLGSECYNRRTIHHEMGHAAGLWHEQQRCDRDTFVVVNSNDDTNFGKRCEPSGKSYGLYNYGSIMHYDFSGSVLYPQLDPPADKFTGNKNCFRCGVTAITELDGLAINDIHKLSSPPLGIAYQSHIQDLGWQSWTMNNNVSGTIGQGRRIESIRISVSNLRPDLNVEYATHVQSIGWLPYVPNGAVSGTTGQGKRIEAMRVRLSGNRTGCSITYRSQLEWIGWQAWVSEDQISGTTGQNRRLEAFQINITCS